MHDNYDESCIFCNPKEETYRYLLHETPNFRIIRDTYPLAEGHLLIIPKVHVSCVGAYPAELFAEFKELYARFTGFIQTEYGHVSTFEHGIYGQTVFHSHVHILPYDGSPADIVPEGPSHYTEGAQLEDLAGKLQQDGGYLFFSMEDKAWLVDTTLAQPPFLPGPLRPCPAGQRAYELAGSQC